MLKFKFIESIISLVSKLRISIFVNIYGPFCSEHLISAPEKYIVTIFSDNGNWTFCVADAIIIPVSDIKQPYNSNNSGVGYSFFTINLTATDFNLYRSSLC